MVAPTERGGYTFVLDRRALEEVRAQRQELLDTVGEEQVAGQPIQ
jgi:hypothetical protein